MSGKDDNLLSKDDMWDDSELIKMYDESVKGNFDNKRRTAAADEKKHQWKVGDICMAPFDDLWYQAKILLINPAIRTAKVHFLEYDDEEDVVVELDKLFKEDEVQYENEGEEEEKDEVQMNTTPSTQVPTSSKLVNSQVSVPIPNMIPPPPQLLQPMSNEKEITNNLMISWYMNGYHTGYFQAMRDFQNKAASSTPQKR